MTCSSGCPAWRASTRSSRSISLGTSTSCSPWAWPTCGRPACSGGSTTPSRRPPLASPEQAAGLARLIELRSRFGDWCGRLAAAPGGASLDHNDLHGGNVFLDASGGARFFDWGDAVVSHPFASALVLRSVVRWLQDVHVETPVERRILDAYLEPFGALGSAAARREVVDVACEVGKVARSLVWRRAVAPMPPDADDPDDFRGAPVAWLLELLDGPFVADVARPVRSRRT